MSDSAWRRRVAQSTGESHGQKASLSPSMSNQPSAPRAVIAIAALIATTEVVFAWQLLSNTKPYKIALLADRFELVALAGGLFGLAAAISAAGLLGRRSPALALPAAALAVPLALFAALAVFVGFASDAPGTPPDLSPESARLTFLRQLSLLGLSSLLVAAALSIAMRARRERPHR